MEMKTTTILIALTMLTTGLAGCTGDPDGGGNDEIDLMLVQEFLNNTSLTVPDTLHSMSGIVEGDGEVDVLDANSSTNNCIFYFGATDDWWNYCNVLSFEIQQPEGFAISINYIVGYLWLVGTDSNGESAQEKFGQEREMYGWITTNCTDGFSSDVWVDAYGTNTYSDGFYLAGAGLDCVHTVYLGAYAHQYTGIGGIKDAGQWDEISWSDWTYSVIWQEHAVTVEN